MAREYKIDVIVDDHGAVETMNKVAAAEDNVASSGTKLGTTLDTVSAKQKVVVADTRGMDEAFGRFKVSAVDADFALSEMAASAGRLPNTFTAVRGSLNDLAEGAGLTVESLGAMGTAGLVVGTAMAAWGITRVVSEFTGLDGAIDSAVGTVRTWVSGSEEAAAKQDVVNAALRNGSGVALTYADALAFMNEKQKEWVTAATEADNAVQRLKAPEDSARAIRNWGAELDLVRAAGVMPSLTADIQSHNFSHVELANRYRVSTEAISLLQREMANETAALKENEAWIAGVIRRMDEQARKIDEQKAKTDEWLQKVRAIELGGDHAYSTLHQWLGQLATDQKYVNELSDQNMQKLFAADAAAKQFLADELAAAQAADALFQQGGAHPAPGTPNDGTQARGPGVNQGTTVPINGGGVNTNPTPIFHQPGVITGIRSFDVGGPTGSGGLSILHPDEYVVPKDGALVRSGSSSAAAAASIIYLSIDAKGATFEDDRALDRLTDKIANRLGQRAGQRGAVR